MAVEVLNPGTTPQYGFIEPLIHPSHLNQENFQVRLARVLSKVFAVLADQSMEEKAKISSLKVQIKQFTNLQAEATGDKGKAGLIITAAKVGLIGLSILLNKDIQEPARLTANAIGDATNQWVSSKYDVKALIHQSLREVVMHELNTITSDAQAKAGTRREFHEVLTAILQLFQSASREQ